MQCRKVQASMQLQKRPRGCPPKKKKTRTKGRFCAPSPSPSCAVGADPSGPGDVDHPMDAVDCPSLFRVVAVKWPSDSVEDLLGNDDCPTDGVDVIDEDSSDDFGNPNLWDARDVEWLPSNEQRKLAIRKKGMSYFSLRMR